MQRDVCPHDVYVSGMCGACGVKLDAPQAASVSMIHSQPGLRVSESYAKKIGKADQEKLINERKLVLLVDLDQTILHTTHEKVGNQPNVHSFVLWPGQQTFYTKLRPHLSEFLEKMSKIYELHIFTFGCRLYAHKIASIIDPDKRFFGERILSRDESVDQFSKRSNLNNLFPCGDAMVCIIDDRADVWRDAGNLIQVKPYSYFKTSISDGALPARGPVAEDDESLDDDVDALKEMLGLDDEDEDDKDEDEGDDDHDEGGDEDEDKDKDKDKDPEEDKKEEKEGAGSMTNDRVAPDSANESRVGNEDELSKGLEPAVCLPEKARTPPRPNETDDSQPGDSKDDDEPEPKRPPSPLEDDTDDHLLHLPSILGRIHEKWYMELDEQRQFLVEGESYRLPDIKDIIRRYLRKRYN